MTSQYLLFSSCSLPFCTREVVNSKVKQQYSIVVHALSTPHKQQKKQKNKNVLLLLISSDRRLE